MTTTIVSTTAQLDSILSSASAGDIIKLNAGTYTKLTKSNLNKAGEVFITYNNVNDLPVFNNQGVDFTNCSNITFDGINFIGLGVESVKSGVSYPSISEPVRFEECSNIKLRNCTFRFYMNCIKFQRCTSGLTVQFCTIQQIQVDPIMVYGSADDILFEYVLFDDWRIDASRRNEFNRHPDSTHIRPNASQVGNNPMSNLTIRRCYINDPSGIAKGFFCQNEKNTPGLGFVSPNIEDCYIRIGRYSPIELSGGENCVIEGNLIRRVDAGVKESPHIIVKYPVASGIIRNNVVPLRKDLTVGPAITFEDGASSSNFILTGGDGPNVVSDTAVPVGWVDLVPGVNVGAFTDPGDVPPTAPETPDTEWADPENTISSDGRFVPAAAPVLELPGRYTGELVIPTISPARAASLVNSVVPGAEVSNFSWTDGTNIGGFRVAQTAVNGAGWRRFEMTGQDPAIYTVAAAGVKSGLKWRYNVNGIWSEYTPYTGTVTAPGDPPVDETLDPLESDQWEVLPTPVEVIPGRFTYLIHEVPGLAPAGITAMQWTFDGTWRNCSETGAGTWQLQPLENNGLEHTVGYLGAPDQTLTIEVRYSMGEEFSEASLTTKSFTGPTPPPPAATFEPGMILRLSGSNLNVVGHQATYPRPNRPSMIDVEGSSAYSDAGTIYVQLPENPPPGAVGQRVFYGGKRYTVDDTGKVSFPEQVGVNFALARGFDDSTPAYHGDAIILIPVNFYMVPRAPGVLSPLFAFVSPQQGPTGTTFAVSASGDLGYPSGTLAYQWKQDGSDIVGATGPNYASAVPEGLTCVVTCTNASGSTDAESASVLVYDAPVALNPTPATLATNSGAHEVPFSSIWSIAGDPDCLSLTVTEVGTLPTGVTIDNVLKRMVLDTDATGALTAEAVVLNGANDAGDADSTVTLNIEEVTPVVAPAIAALDPQTKDEGTGDRWYNISSEITGTEPITKWMEPKVVKAPEIIDNGDGTYGFHALVAGTPLPVATQQWKLDGSDVSGQTGATIDANALGLSGELTIEVTVTNEHGSHSLESAGLAVSYTVNPVHLGTTIGGTNSGTSYGLTTPAYSTGDLVVLAVRIGQGALAGHSNDIVPPATGPDGETLTVVQAHFDNVTSGDDMSMAVYRYIAAADRAAGASISFGYDIVEQIVVSASVFDAGTFNASTPISNVTPAWSETVVASASSGALTATYAGGMVITAIAGFADNITGTPAGWTGLVTALDVGALTGYVGKRDAFTTAGENVAAASFTLAGDGAAWVSTTFVVNPG